ncbi:MAG TPA: c-type cytochrome [Rhodanobacteraceae bacterium]|nr:c-type cytochrome [Rhodanobacteraceae bacterium]
MSIRHIAAAVALLFGATAFAQEAAPAAPSSTTAASAAAAPASVVEVAVHAGDAKAGAAKAAVCGACHGMDGNSTDPQYPRLAGQNEQYIARQLELFKSGARQNPIMLGFASTLSAQDMRDVGAYFASQKPLPGVADAALAKQGEALYRGGDVTRGIPACMSCHGPDGSGNPGPPYPHLGSQHADYVQAQLTAWHDGTSWGKDANAQIMPAIAKRLTADEIAALSSYIEGLHSTRTK